MIKNQILTNEISLIYRREDGNPIRLPGDYFCDSITNGKLKYFNRFAYLEYLDQIAEKSYYHAMNFLLWFFYGGGNDTTI